MTITYFKISVAVQEQNGLPMNRLPDMSNVLSAIKTVFKGKDVYITIGPVRVDDDDDPDYWRDDE